MKWPRPSPFPRALASCSMSWEGVRGLQQMKATLPLGRNLIAQNRVSYDVVEWVEHVVEDLEEVETAISKGECP